MRTVSCDTVKPGGKVKVIGVVKSTIMVRDVLSIRELNAYESSMGGWNGSESELRRHLLSIVCSSNGEQ